MNLLDILSWSQIPDSTHLVTSTTCKDHLMCWMPAGLVDCALMLEWSLRLTSRHRTIPQFDSGVHRPWDHHPLVNMTPFARLHFCLMASEYSQWCRLAYLPEFKCGITASRYDLVRRTFTKACIECGVRCLEWLNHLQWLSYLILKNCNCTCSYNTEILRLRYNHHLSLEGTEPHWYVTQTWWVKMLSLWLHWWKVRHYPNLLIFYI